MTAARVLIGGGAVDPARLYRRLLQQLPPAPTALLVMPGSSHTRPGPTAVQHTRGSRPVSDTADRADVGLQQEERAVARSVTSLGLADAQVDLVGFSGGATCALAYATTHPHRVRRLVLIEPSWLGNHLSAPGEAAYLHELDAVMSLPDEQLGPAFTRHFSPYRHPAAALPIPPPELVRASAGMRQVWRRWRRVDAQLDLSRLPAPLLVAAGARSHPRMVGAARHAAAVAPKGGSCITALHDHFTVTAGVTQQIAGFLTDPDPRMG